MKQTIICFTVGLALLLAPFHGRAQGQAVTELKIGDRLPDHFVFNNVRGSTGPVSLAGLSKGKLLLIDFWATWCGPCIKGLTEMETLKKTFDGKVEVLAVTYESQEKVNAFISRRRDLKNLTLPMLTSDTLLARLFPHRVVPHIVWIDQTGTVVSITSKDAVSEKSIRDLLENKQTVLLKVKQDLVDFDYSQPLKEGYSENIGSSMMTRGIPGTATRGHSEVDYRSLPPFVSRLKKADLIKRETLFNYTVAALYMRAAFAGRVSVINRSRLVIEAKDKDVVHPSKQFLESMAGRLDEWKDKHLFCYQLSLEEHLSPERFYGHMLSDLNRFLPYTGKLEKKVMPCYVITFHGDKNKIASYDRISKKYIVNEGNTIKGLESFTMAQVVDYLNFDSRGTVFVDETNLEDLLDLPVNFTIDKDQGQIDTEQLSASLKKLGFEISLQERPVDVLVIRDK